MEVSHDEQLWYYEVPEENILFTEHEELFLYNDFNWKQISFSRPPAVPRIWKLGMAKDFFSATEYVTDFFWQLKKQNEKLQVKVLKERKAVCIEEKFHKRDELFKVLDLLINYGEWCCVQYFQDSQLNLTIFLSPAVI